MAELVSIPISDVTIAVGLGGVLGGVQTPLLREYVDRKYPLKGIESLKGLGYPGTLTGVGLGAGALVLSAVGASKGKDGRPRIPESANLGLLAYASTALAGGLASAMWPAVTESDCTKALGYFYDGTCHKAAKAATTGMQGPQVQYADMGVLQRMTAELQRLAQENAQLRSMHAAPPPAIEVTQVIPGVVKRRQGDYGFMAPGIETGQPIAGQRAVQMKKRFDFMG